MKATAGDQALDLLDPCLGLLAQTPSPAVRSAAEHARGSLEGDDGRHGGVDLRGESGCSLPMTVP
jgi:hypothetical protein